MRVGVIGFVHETNSFSIEENDTPRATLLLGEEVLNKAHPRSYIGGFVEGARRPNMELVPIADVFFVLGGIIHAPVFEHYRDIIIQRLRSAGPLDAIYFALHGAAAVHDPYADAEGSLISAVRGVVGDSMPCVATYDFHGNYTDWEVSAVVPFLQNTNPHIDAFERGQGLPRRRGQSYAGRGKQNARN